MPGLRVTQVAAGGMHSCVLTDAGEVRAPKQAIPIVTHLLSPVSEVCHQADSSGLALLLDLILLC